MKSTLFPEQFQVTLALFSLTRFNPLTEDFTEGLWRRKPRIQAGWTGARWGSLQGSDDPAWLLGRLRFGCDGFSATHSTSTIGVSPKTGLRARFPRRLQKSPAVLIILENLPPVARESDAMTGEEVDFNFS